MRVADLAGGGTVTISGFRRHLPRRRSRLFDSSIVENIRYIKLNATMNQIVQMARLTGAHEFAPLFETPALPVMHLK